MIGTILLCTKARIVKIPNLKPFDPCPECSIGTLKNDTGRFKLLRCTSCEKYVVANVDGGEWYYASKDRDFGYRMKKKK